jgi:hypothetical protein
MARVAEVKEVDRSDASAGGRWNKALTDWPQVSIPVHVSPLLLVPLSHHSRGGEGRTLARHARSSSRNGRATAAASGGRTPLPRLTQDRDGDTDVGTLAASGGGSAATMTRGLLMLTSWMGAVGGGVE